ncbi:MAG: hypothetical protein HGA45_05365 [Chloroflexales bacterium]|nr:hypothetical protein [Chloroflexales bacterium]
MLQSFRDTPSYRAQTRQPAEHDHAVPRALIVATLTLALGALVLALGIGATTAASQRVSPASAGDGVADWTVLVYMASDNNLEAAALNDLREIAHVGSSAQLTIVAQVDRIAAPNLWDDTTAGDWAGTRRFLVQPGIEPDAAMAAQDLGELNTGDPATLADFITWGVRTYPARRYALVLWSHGAAWQGLASDETSGGDSLSLPELGSALATARAQTGGTPLDLIGFDACLMAQLDVFQTIAPYARVAVASAELEPAQGWAWDAWLGALAANPGQDAAAIAGVIVDSYISSYQGSDDVTLVALDLAQVDQISAGLDRLAGALLAGQSADDTSVAQARTAVDVYASDSVEAFNAVDLGLLTQLIVARGATGEVAAAAAATESAIQQARLAYGAGLPHRDASGISVYFPPTAAQYLSAYEHDSPLPGLTRWAEFLKAYHHSLVG